MQTITKLAAALLFAATLSVTGANAHGFMARGTTSHAVMASDDGTVITVNQGEKVDVLLDENTPKADTWAFKAVTGNAVTFSSEEHVEGDMVRADGSFAAVYEGVFNAKQSGTSSVEIVSKDTNGNPTTFKITIVVQ
jgi:predicted secreted protein